jgi:hypothetical protein
MLSLRVFSFYVYGLAFGLLFAPNFFLPLLGIPTTTEVWVRCSGMLLLGLAFYYECVIRARMEAFLPFTIWVRAAVIVFFGVFVGLGWAKPVFLVFGLTDMFGAIWTILALRADARSAGDSGGDSSASIQGGSRSA